MSHLSLSSCIKLKNLCIKATINAKNHIFSLLGTTQQEREKKTSNECTLLLCKFNVSIAVDRHKKHTETRSKEEENIKPYINVIQ